VKDKRSSSLLSDLLKIPSNQDLAFAFGYAFAVDTTFIHKIRIGS